METTPNIIYYTCNTHLDVIEQACRKQLKLAGLPIVSVSLNKNIEFGESKITLMGERGPEMMHQQVLAGLQTSRADYVFLCESDVLYHPSHFDFVPESDKVYYYNTNVWKWKYPSGPAIWTDDLVQVSGICASRKLLLDFYSKKVAQIMESGFDRRYEPRGNVKLWQSKEPNVCIRHDANLTMSKWSPTEFRNPRYAKGWKEGEIPNWAKGLI